MSILALTSNTLIGTAAAGNIEYNGQFYGTDSAASRAQLQRITQGTAVASTSGTSIDFTGLPAWVKKITVMFNAVSTNSNSNKQIQIGSGSFTTTGYISSGTYYNTSGAFACAQYTTGFGVYSPQAADALYGSFVLSLLNSSTNNWVLNGSVAGTAAGVALLLSAGGVSLGGTLDRVRITTVNGTDVFDAGSINILYEG